MRLSNPQPNPPTHHTVYAPLEALAQREQGRVDGVIQLHLLVVALLQEVLGVHLAGSGLGCMHGWWREGVELVGAWVGSKD